jgi:hypothetical protein
VVKFSWKSVIWSRTALVDFAWIDPAGKIQLSVRYTPHTLYHLIRSKEKNSITKRKVCCGFRVQLAWEQHLYLNKLSWVLRWRYHRAWPGKLVHRKKYTIDRKKWYEGWREANQDTYDTMDNENEGECEQKPGWNNPLLLFWGFCCIWKTWTYPVTVRAGNLTILVLSVAKNKVSLR